MNAPNTDIAMSTENNKAALRTAALAKREAFATKESEAHKSTSSAIATQILKFIEKNSIDCIMGYYPFGSEVNIHSVLVAIHHNPSQTLALPQILKKSEAAAMSPSFPRLSPIVPNKTILLAEQIKPGRYNIPVPVNGQPLPLADIECILVPGLLFDTRCYRLGRGGGYYDEFIAACKATPQKRLPLLVGVCFDFQLQAELPLASHDEQLHIVITEKAVYKI